MKFEITIRNYETGITYSVEANSIEQGVRNLLTLMQNMGEL